MGVSDAALELLMAREARAYLAVAREREELRAVLAPLLEADGLPQYIDIYCQFCRADRMGTGEPHAPDCPVLRKDALLGR